MATHALIGYLNTEGAPTLTTTYNHYDGYPDNLGTGLESFYDDDSKAKEIANVGYISYLNPQTGEWDADHKNPPEKVQLPDNFNDAMEEIATIIDYSRADFGYIWTNENEEWITIRNYGIPRMVGELEMSLAHLKDKFTFFPEQPEQVAEEPINEAFVRQMQYRAGIKK